MDTDKRSEVRLQAKRYYHAEIRLVGVPVYEVKIKDLSSKGTSILVKENSLLMNHLKSGRTVMIRYFLESRDKPSKLYKATVKHITVINEGQFKGHSSVGLDILKEP